MNDGVTFAASDGSVLHRTSASFGLTIIHVATGTRILQAMGAAPGIQPSSFRAEAYGALAVIRVIWRLSQFTGREMSFTLRHWIDNSGLVRRITAELKRQYPDPYSTLHPDWDVIQNLVSTMQLFGEACSYKAQWVKSHQDANRPAQELSLAARMNCEADTLAGEFQMMEYRERAEVPLIAGSGAHLIIAGATITGRYKQAIRDALSLPSYHIYLESRFQWEPTVRQSVHWESYRRIIRSFRSSQATVVKHLHGIAPTGKYANRYDAHQPSSCPACNHDMECNDHLLSCPAPSRAKWRRENRRKLYAMRQGKTSTDLILWQILEQGLARVHRGDTSEIDATEYPEVYRELLRQQNKLGWIQLYRGRWACQWIKLHETWSTDWDPNTIYTSGIDWVSVVGRVLLASWLELWRTRNDTPR